MRLSQELAQEMQYLSRHPMFEQANDPYWDPKFNKDTDPSTDRSHAKPLEAVHIPHSIFAYRQRMAKECLRQDPSQHLKSYLGAMQFQVKTPLGRTLRNRQQEVLSALRSERSNGSQNEYERGINYDQDEEEESEGAQQHPRKCRNQQWLTPMRNKLKQINFPMRAGLLINPPRVKRPTEMASVIYTNQVLIDRVRTRQLEAKLEEEQTEQASKYSHNINANSSERLILNKNFSKLNTNFQSNQGSTKNQGSNTKSHVRYDETKNESIAPPEIEEMSQEKFALQTIDHDLSDQKIQKPKLPMQHKSTTSAEASSNFYTPQSNIKVRMLKNQGQAVRFQSPNLSNKQTPYGVEKIGSPTFTGTTTKHSQMSVGSPQHNFSNSYCGFSFRIRENVAKSNTRQTQSNLKQRQQPSSPILGSPKLDYTKVWPIMYTPVIKNAKLIK